MTDKLIIVCVPTCKRPVLLAACLAGINKLVRPQNHNIQIVIVDNDIEESAKAVFLKYSTKNNYPIHYFVESKRGLSSVRNRLLDEAIGIGADFIAFIDDDEQPQPLWLVNFVTTMQACSADVCTGPVAPIYDDNITGSTKTKPTGSRPRYVSTNNVFFKSSLISEQGLRFDPFFNFIGGEDFDFFEQSARLENSHVWVDEAIVFETITEERNSLRYLFYRHFTGGINSILRYRRSNPRWRVWLRYLPKIVGKIIDAVFNVVLGVLKMKVMHFVSAIKKLANSLGYLAGLLNIVVERYKYVGTDKTPPSTELR